MFVVIDGLFFGFFNSRLYYKYIIETLTVLQRVLYNSESMAAVDLLPMTIDKELFLTSGGINLKRFFGDKAFYKMVIAIAVPVMVQNGITNLVSLLDNIMVGQIGTEQMSGVAIVNQLIFIFFLCVFGGMSGVGIFTAQYYGYKDDEGIRHTFRYKLWLGIAIVAFALLIFLTIGPDLIQMYLNGNKDGGDLAAAKRYGVSYLRVILISLPAILMTQLYASTLRECGQTRVPMIASLTAVCVNLVFNYILIFGHFGFPKLGVIGAAIATVISRYVEMIVIIVYSMRHTHEHTYFKGIYKTIKVPKHLAEKFFKTGMPILVNEALWSLGVALLAWAYSARGLNVVAGQNIANTVNNIFNVAFIAMGDAVAILVGQALGSGEIEKAKDWSRKLTVCGMISALVMGSIMLSTSGLFPQIYNTNAQAKHIATLFITVQAIAMTKDAFLHCTYFTLRSGGKTFITFLFDSVFMLTVSVPIAYVLSNYTNIHVALVFALVHAADLLKCLIGFILIKKGVWAKNIVKDN